MVIKVKTKQTLYRHEDADWTEVSDGQLFVVGEDEVGEHMRRAYRWEEVLWYEE